MPANIPVRQETVMPANIPIRQVLTFQTDICQKQRQLYQSDNTVILASKSELAKALSHLSAADPSNRFSLVTGQRMAIPPIPW